MQTNFLPLVNPAAQPVAVRSPEQLPQFAGNQAPSASPETGTAVPVVNARDNGLAADLASQQRRQPDEKALNDSLKKLNDHVSLINSDLEFTTDKETDTPVVRVVDRGTKEVIRQIPSEEAVRLAQALEHLQGLLIRDKA
ncbi:flagellar protein FlaG [Crenobacter sp. SG2303]|uniref:Flagellar protein FlaG n=1 Tax=Crenobacter oryzisoli TaxID=3056844 RepID=A0ABT7XPX7_9NEIS|nr:flagellar protein FlaG [Crenobacter sp. SG2303]MDN0075836.1 flagellar protein FlaG [Crenobacter sp. SG2303]